MTDILPNQTPAIEYTATTSGIQANDTGVYVFDFWDGGGAGTCSIDIYNKNDAGYRVSTVAPLIGSVEAHQVIRLPPHAVFRVTITGGTDPVVMLTPVRPNHI
jgi:hypothetical protein